MLSCRCQSKLAKLEAYANYMQTFYTWKNQYKSHLFGLIDQNVCCIFWLFRRAAMAPPNGRRWVKMGQRFFALPLTGKHWGTQNFDVALGCQKLVPFTTPGIHLAIFIAHGTTRLRAMLKKRPKTFVLNLGPMLNIAERYWNHNRINHAVGPVECLIECWIFDYLQIDPRHRSSADSKKKLVTPFVCVCERRSPLSVQFMSAWAGLLGMRLNQKNEKKM